MEIGRKRHSNPQELVELVRNKLRRLEETGGKVNYLTIVPDGEPTLDLALGELISKLKETSVPVAVISNASLIWRSDVREELALADWVSLKIDAISQDLWKRVDRPHPSISHDDILDGMEQFSRSYKGTLCTETMLVKDLNDGPAELEGIARFIASRLDVHTAYISVPTRPPTASWVRMPEADAVAAAYALFVEKKIPVETLTGYEGNAFIITDDPAEEILNITAVHPMRSDAVEEVLKRRGAGDETVKRLVYEGRIRRVTYGKWTYYVRIMEESRDVEVPS